MTSVGFRMNLKNYADKAQNTYFDLRNSPYHTCPHPITANYSFKYLSVSYWPKSLRYFFITSYL